MKNLKTILLSALSVVAIDSVQAQFTLDGQIRPRAEFRNGYRTPMDSSQTNAFFVDQRTRLNARYKSEDYEAYISIQDIRVWGSTGQLNLTDGFLSIHEAWGKANLNKQISLKFGRQEIKYDDDRIFGNVEWAQQARSHDALLFQFNNTKSKLDVGVAFNQGAVAQVGTDYTGPSTYRDMYYAWYNTKLKEKLEISLLALALGNQVNITAGADTYKSINYTATLGTHTKFNSGKFDLNFNGFYQLGSDVASYTSTDGKTAAKGFGGYLLGLNANYALTKEFKVGLIYETMSGNSRTDTTDAYNSVNHSFNPVFGTNHKFNGYMDYFYVGSGHGSAGLQDAALTLKYKKEKWSAGLDAHFFMMGLGVEVFDQDSYNAEFNRLITAGDVTGASELDIFDYKYKSNLGTEIDLTLETKLNKSVSLVAGYSMMLASPTLYHLKSVDQYNIDISGNKAERDLPMNHWGYVMIVFKPKFFEKELN